MQQRYVTCSFCDEDFNEFGLCGLCNLPDCINKICINCYNECTKIYSFDDIDEITICADHTIEKSSEQDLFKYLNDNYDIDIKTTYDLSKYEKEKK